MGIKAIYRKGVFKPIEKVELPEGAEVEVILKDPKAIIRRYAGILKKSEHDWEEEYYEYIQERAGHD